MNSKERVISALIHQKPDRTPLDGSFRQDVWKKLEDHFGTTDTEIIMDKLGLDIRTFTLEPGAAFANTARPSPWQIPEIGMGKNNLVHIRENGWLEDEYGICRIPNKSGLYWHYTCHPLAEAETSEIKKYIFPEPHLQERYTNVVRGMKQHGKDYFTLVEFWTIFKTCWELRGFEKFLMDLHMDPEFVETLADKALLHRIEQTKQVIKHGIDMIFIMGDIAMQDSMMVSPEVWRRYFKPRLKIWIEEIRKLQPGIYFMFHSDGNMEPVLEDLIEIGFDAVDPIQPESMDVADIKRRFGDRTCLHGTISCQKTLPYGTPDDVKTEVIHRIKTCGRDGGLILAPSNTMQPDVSLEKILTLYCTAKNYSL